MSEDDPVEVMDSISSGSLQGVLPGWWGPPGHAASDLDPPARVGEVLVVISAHETQVLEVGVALVLDPLQDVVGLAPGRRPITTGEQRLPTAISSPRVIFLPISGPSHWALII